MAARARRRAVLVRRQCIQFAPSRRLQMSLVLDAGALTALRGGPRYRR